MDESLLAIVKDPKSSPDEVADALAKLLRNAIQDDLHKQYSNSSSYLRLERALQAARARADFSQIAARLLVKPHALSDLQLFIEGEWHDKSGIGTYDQAEFTGWVCSAMNYSDAAFAAILKRMIALGWHTGGHYHDLSHILSAYDLAELITIRTDALIDLMSSDPDVTSDDIESLLIAIMRNTVDADVLLVGLQNAMQDPRYQIDVGTFREYDDKLNAYIQSFQIAMASAHVPSKVRESTWSTIWRWVYEPVTVGLGLIPDVGEFASIAVALLAKPPDGPTREETRREGAENYQAIADRLTAYGHQQLVLAGDYPLSQAARHIRAASSGLASSAKALGPQQHAQGGFALTLANLLGSIDSFSAHLADNLTALYPILYEAEVKYADTDESQFS